MIADWSQPQWIRRPRAGRTSAYQSDRRAAAMGPVAKDRKHFTKLPSSHIGTQLQWSRPLRAGHAAVAHDLGGIGPATMEPATRSREHQLRGEVRAWVQMPQWSRPLRTEARGPLRSRNLSNAAAMGPVVAGSPYWAHRPSGHGGCRNGAAGEGRKQASGLVAAASGRAAAMEPAERTGSTTAVGTLSYFNWTP